MTAIADLVNYNRRTILAAMETTYGVSPDVGMANALDIYDAGAPEIRADMKAREPVRPWLGSSYKVPTGLHRATEFAFSLAGAGTAGSNPAYDTVLRMAAMAGTVISGTSTIADAAVAAGGTTNAFAYTKGDAYAGAADRTVTITCTTGGGSGVAQVTVSAPAAGGEAAYSQTGVTVTNAAPLALPGGATILPDITTLSVGDAWTIALSAVKVRYRPISSGFESASLWYHLDGEMFRFSGARGHVSEIAMTVGDDPKIKVQVLGLHNVTTNAALPVVDFTNSVIPVPVGSVNTSGTFFGHALRIQQLTLKVDESAAFADRYNDAQIAIPQRSWTGQIVFDMPYTSTINFEEMFRSMQTGVLSITHGTASGNIVEVVAPSVQIAAAPKISKASEGMAQITCDLGFLPVNGNDELSLQVR